ncbi:GFA family protein [Xylophilus sp. Kf1]|nr:GFA family protein [Xylophilus sp. Kf1]
MREALHSGSCHCGAIVIEIPFAPDHLTNCNCSICWRYGALWAYFVSGSVNIRCTASATEEYGWGIRDLRFFRCRTCGVVTHWEKAQTSDSSLLGINMRNFDLGALSHARVQAVDGRASGANHFKA